MSGQNKKPKFATLNELEFFLMKENLKWLKEKNEMRDSKFMQLSEKWAKENAERK